MDEADDFKPLPLRQMITRFAVMVTAAAALGVTGETVFGLNLQQSTACAVFVAIILGTLMFWGFRLAIAFLGLAVLVMTNSLSIPEFVQSSALDVILFLVGMMIVVGALRDLGFFTWIVQLIVAMPNISGRKFIAATAAASALLACAVDEVTSIIFVSALIFQVCDRLKLNPTPYIMIAVLATNVGSAGTMMGNPVGIFIGTRAGLSFSDFMTWSFPIMLAALALTIAVTLLYFRRELRQFDVNLKERLARNLSLAPRVEVPFLPGLVLLLAAVGAIAAHHQLETWLNLRPNSMLIVAPLICAGVVMIIRSQRARHYVEREVDWWTLVFFMLLFAIAGTLEHTGVAHKMAAGFIGLCGSTPTVLIPTIMGVAALGSAFVDNVIFVAAFAPVIDELGRTINGMPLWWALLFGACFGGNITMIGSTANIVALGMLEKRAAGGMSFFRWLKVGLMASLAALGMAWFGLWLLSPLMPDRPTALEFSQLNREFTGKNVILRGVAEPAASLPEPAVAWPSEKRVMYDYWVLRLPADMRVPSVVVAAPKGMMPAPGMGTFRGALYRGAEGVPMLMLDRADWPPPQSGNDLD